MGTNFTAAKLTSRALIRVHGPDWRSFLQGLITQDVETLVTGEARFAALLTPQGRLLHDLFLIGDAEGCLLDVVAADRDAIIQRLSIYRLRAKVEITADGREILALWSDTTGEPGSGWASDPRLATLGWRGYGAIPPSGANLADEDAYDAHRLGLGVPEPVKDAPTDSTYPIEANFDLLGGIDFQKGCFVGQETTSRMKRRGAIKTRLLPIAFDGPPPAFGAEVLAGDLRAGEVRSGRDGRAMALLRLDRIDGAALSVDGRPVFAETPAYLADSVRSAAKAD